MIVSAFSVETTPAGFAQCTWPATSKGAAERLAKALSLALQNDARYPNAFWVVDSKDQGLCKYFHGTRHERQLTI